MYKDKFRSATFEIASNNDFVRMQISKCIQLLKEGLLFFAFILENQLVRTFVM